MKRANGSATNDISKIENYSKPLVTVIPVGTVSSVPAMLWIPAIGRARWSIAIACE
jgi:hypothetical protein